MRATTVRCHWLRHTGRPAGNWPARGPEDIALLLGRIIVEATDSHEILDIFEASGLPRQSLADLTPEFLTQATKSSTPHLAIEALRNSILKETTRSTGHNLIRQQQFSQRLTALMTKYTNQQLTSAEVIAALVEMAKEVSAEGNRGKHFQPPLDDKELAFYDVVSTNESAVDVMGGGVLAQIARDLLAVMRRDTRTDWTVRDDVKAKLRSSIKRLLVKNGFCRAQPGARLRGCRRTRRPDRHDAGRRGSRRHRPVLRRPLRWWRLSGHRSRPAPE